MNNYNEDFWKELIGKIVYIEWESEYQNDNKYTFVDFDPNTEWVKLESTGPDLEIIWISLDSITSIRKK